MFRSASSFVAVTAAALLFAGCPVLDVQADVSEVCVTYPGLQVAGVPIAIGSNTIDQSFVVDDLGAIQSLAKLDANLVFVRAEARATSGITDFAFVQAAHIAVSSGDPTSTLPTLDIYDCDGDCEPSGDSLEVPAPFQHSAIAYAQSGSIVVDVVLTGQPPTTDWTMDVDVCFRGHIGYQAGI